MSEEIVDLFEALKKSLKAVTINQTETRDTYITEVWHHELEIVCGERRATVYQQPDSDYWTVHDWTRDRDPSRLAGFDLYWRQGAVNLSGLNKKKAREHALAIVKLNEQEAFAYTRKVLGLKGAT